MPASAAVSYTHLDVYKRQVQSAAAAAVRATRTGLIGVIGTPATVKSGSYNAAIAALMPGARIVALSLIHIWAPANMDSMPSRSGSLAMALTASTSMTWPSM